MNFQRLEFLKNWRCGSWKKYVGEMKSMVVEKKIREDGYSEKVVFREEDFERGKGG